MFESRTEPEARLYKKGHGGEAKLSYLGHAVIENRVESTPFLGSLNHECRLEKEAA